jgi:uncharacterized protein (DUF1800 family)
MSRRTTVAAVFALSLFAGAMAYAKKSLQIFQQQIPKEERMEQALNRLTFGPRPGDADRVKAMGLKKWIDLQLHPSRIPQNPVLAAKLKVLDSLSMSSEELVVNYPEPRAIRDNRKGGLPVPIDPERTRMLQQMAERVELRQKLTAAPPANADQEEVSLLTPEERRSLRTGTLEQRLAAFQAMPQDKQDDLLVAFPQRFQGLFGIASPELRRKLQLTAGPAQVVIRDLMEGKLLRAIYSDRQLEEMLTDFWYNHFNVYIDKGADRYLVTAYERDVIRPHVLGKFRDLLEATAKSPAMLFYLDNWESVGPSPAPQRPGAARRGLNENYGRELLELHTLGVDGGYTQKDVTEVARCFTGWSINRPQLGGGFQFNARAHDNGEKTVLGQKIHSSGMEDGEKVLDLLARHPSTARFISRKLAMRFVADDPPASLVDRMSETFRKTDGDLRAVMKTMLESKEFWSVGAYRTKLKSPLELVASAVRAGNGDVDYARSLVDQVAQMGEPLYRKLEPTGYSNSGKEWLNSAGLVARMNFALNLADNKVPGVKVDGVTSGVALGSPEFQKH